MVERPRGKPARVLPFGFPIKKMSTGQDFLTTIKLAGLDGRETRSS